MMNSDKQYFAAKPAPECARDCSARVDDFYRFVSSSNIWTTWANSYRAYHRPGLNLGQTSRFGSNAEYLDVNLNRYRNAIEHIVAQVLGTRLDYFPRAMNSDYESNAQTILARGLVEYYSRTRNYAELDYQIVRDGFLFAESFLYQFWDFSQGDVVATHPETGQTIRDGDINSAVYRTWNVVRDCSQPSTAERQWHILVARVNKYDLAAQYPQHSEKILNASALPQYAQYGLSPMCDLWSAWGKDSQDYACIYTLVHQPTPSVPNGRLLTYLDNDTPLSDAPLPKGTQVIKYFMSDWPEMPFAYSHAWDALPLQDNMDRLIGAVTTNNAAFATQLIWLPPGLQVSENVLAKGLAVVRGNSDKEPKAIQLTASAPETYKLIDFYRGEIDSILAVGPIARNDPEVFKASGSALSLLQNVSAQFNSNIQGHFARFVEARATSMIFLLQVFAEKKRVAEIAGKANQRYMVEFNQTDIQGVQRVYVEIGNTGIQFNHELATTLVNQGVIKNVETLVDVLTTGRAETAYEPTQAEQMLIRRENENLMQGMPQPVLITDNHPLHLPQHLGVLADPNTRADAAAHAPVLAHVMEHLAQWAQCPPELMFLHRAPTVASLNPAMQAMPVGAEPPETPSAPEGAEPTPGQEPPQA